MKYFFMISLCFALQKLQAQELYIFTEPASNMAAQTVGLRLNNYLMPMTHSGNTAYRADPELMWGVNKNLMLHLNVYASNMFQSTFKFEGGSVYAKYRFLSVDDIHKHFRMAAFGKLSMVDNPYQISHTEAHKMPDGNGGFVTHYIPYTASSNEFNIDGNHSGFQVGIIATQLLHKLALSTSVANINRWDNLGKNAMPANMAKAGLQGTFSAGYLLLPKAYTDYKQTNFNLYCEFLAQKLYGAKESFIDVAPGVQFIFNSTSRLDLGYRFQLAGNMSRFSTEQFLVRFEYNWLGK